MVRPKVQPHRPPEPWFIRSEPWLVSDHYSLPELAYGLPEPPYGMTDDRPSGLRVLTKSLHLLAFGWLATVVWLWLAQIQLNSELFNMPPEGYGVRTLVEGVIPALLVEVMAFWLASLIARVPGSGDRRREWLHALWWTLIPNLLLLGTAYLMILASRS